MCRKNLRVGIPYGPWIQMTCTSQLSSMRWTKTFWAEEPIPGAGLSPPVPGPQEVPSCAATMVWFWWPQCVQLRETWRLYKCENEKTWSPWNQKMIKISLRHPNRSEPLHWLIPRCLWNRTSECPRPLPQSEPKSSGKLPNVPHRSTSFHLQRISTVIHRVP